MRHRVEKRKLGRSTAHRDAMLRNMVTSLVEHERVRTTLPKAKEVRRVAERMITLAKRGDLHARRQALKVIRKKSVAHKLFAELAIHFSGRDGGYTRIVRMEPRPGDNAAMAILELVAKTSAFQEKVKKAAAGKPEKKSTLTAAREAISSRRKKSAKESKLPKGKDLTGRKSKPSVKAVREKSGE